MAKPLEIDYRPNDVYLPLFDAVERVVILYGGAGSGKSVAIADALILRCLHESGLRVLVVRKVARTIRESCYRLLLSRMSDLGVYHLFQTNKSDLSFRCVNGSEIISAGLDDVEKLKSIAGVVVIWLEEATEASEEDFDQLNLRLRGRTKYRKQLYLSFNPISKSHWLKSRFFDVPDERVKAIHSTYLDNYYIDEEYRIELEKLKIKNPRYYQVYALGEWGDLEEGRLFRRDQMRKISRIPDDARGVVYCDPNLAKKSKGDTTSITVLLYSPSLQKYIIAGLVCRSMDRADTLLDELFSKVTNRTRTLAFDGNVNQESHWSEHIRAYCRARSMPIPAIEYKRYRTDDIAKNASLLWNEGNILVLEGLDQTKEGEEYFSQVFSFSGKKRGSIDDAPDSLICAVETLVDRGLATRAAVSEQLRKLL